MSFSDCYIPDLTERYPEGFGGIDLTDCYFPDESLIEERFWEEVEKDMASNEEREVE